MPKEQINAMGTLNNRWGVCGFNSSLYALYEHNPRKRADLTSAAKVDTRVAAEIKTFLKMLQAEGNAKLLSDIEAFTRSFGGKRAGFTIAGYIQKIDAEAAKEGGEIQSQDAPGPFPGFAASRRGGLFAESGGVSGRKSRNRSSRWKLAHVFDGERADHWHSRSKNGELQRVGTLGLHE